MSTQPNPQMNNKNTKHPHGELDKQALLVPSWGGGTYHVGTGRGVGLEAGYSHLLGVLPAPQLGVRVGGRNFGVSAGLGPLPYLGMDSGVQGGWQWNNPRSLWKFMRDGGQPLIESRLADLQRAKPDGEYTGRDFRRYGLRVAPAEGEDEKDVESKESAEPRKAEKAEAPAKEPTKPTMRAKAATHVTPTMNIDVIQKVASFSAGVLDAAAKAGLDLVTAGNLAKAAADKYALEKFAVDLADPQTWVRPDAHLQQQQAQQSVQDPQQPQPGQAQVAPAPPPSHPLDFANDPDVRMALAIRRDHLKSKMKETTKAQQQTAAQVGMPAQPQPAQPQPAPAAMKAAALKVIAKRANEISPSTREAADTLPAAGGVMGGISGGTLGALGGGLIGGAAGAAHNLLSDKEKQKRTMFDSIARRMLQGGLIGGGVGAVGGAGLGYVAGRGARDDILAGRPLQ